MPKPVKQLSFHPIPYVQCTVCGTCGQRKRKKIICPCCQQSVFDKTEEFHCKICGGLMREITPAEHDWELHYGITRQEDPDLDKISCVKKPHLEEGVQIFSTGRLDAAPTPPAAIREARRKSKNKSMPERPTKYCSCGAVIDKDERQCEVCAWANRLNKRGVEAVTLNAPLFSELLK